jgi:hypothetical protein
MLFLEGTKKSSNAVCFKPIANKVAFTFDFLAAYYNDNVSEGSDNSSRSSACSLPYIILRK